jgi:hypothetical protein
MTAPGRRLLHALVGVLTACTLFVACSDGSEGAPGASCSNYQAGGSRSVTCPGVPGCSCGAPSVCCLAAIESRNGSCVDPRTCAGVELTCDGPEDCNGGVCCLTATGSSCSDKSACTGRWLCRADGQCNGSPSGGNCVPADFGTKGTNDRGLDGAIGLCSP